jgi:hypothetical protein
VDWERGRFRVTSPKTERHEGKAERWVPIFPELRPYLEEAFELAAEGSVYVITRYRDTNRNLRTQLNRIIRRAGLTAWPRLFQNLRASRETELTAEYPLHVVCAWIGNTERIAAKHYLQVTEDYFARAAEDGAQDGAGAAPEPPATRRAAGPRRRSPAVRASRALRKTCSAPQKTVQRAARALHRALQPALARPRPAKMNPGRNRGFHAKLRRGATAGRGGRRTL